MGTKSTSNRKLTDAHWRVALKLYRDYGWTIGRIAERFDCSDRTVWHHVRLLGARRPKSPAWHSAVGRRIYQAWESMRQRCFSRRHPGYRRYGARGIGICEEWDDFHAFHAWACRSGYKPGRILALIDEDADYGPKNCRWVSKKELRRLPGRMPPLPGTWHVRAFGEVKSLAAWGRDPRCAVSWVSLARRLMKGIASEAAISSPPRTRWDAPLPLRSGPKVVRPKRRLIDQDRVVRMYSKQGRSRREIAETLGFAYSAVCTVLLRAGISAKDDERSTPEWHRLYLLWRSLITRTTNPTYPLYRFCGARGVRLCREWKEFRPFYEWAMRTGSKPNAVLMRNDDRQGYSPKNCRWGTRADLVREREKRERAGRRTGSSRH